jgi:hypothetical protein
MGTIGFGITEIAVEEELQHRDASAANHSVPGRI